MYEKETKKKSNSDQNKKKSTKWNQGIKFFIRIYQRIGTCISIRIFITGITTTEKLNN